MKHTIEMGSGAVICVPNFTKADAGIRKLLEGIHIQTHRQQGDIISLLLIFSSMRKIL
jgi:hypothetical protein